MSERTTSSSWASGIVQALELGGVDCRQLFARLGLDYAALSDPDARFPQGVFYASHLDLGVAAFDWRDIATVLKLPACPR